MSDDDDITTQRNKFCSWGNMTTRKFRSCSEESNVDYFNIFVQLSTAPQYGQDLPLKLKLLR